MKIQLHQISESASEAAIRNHRFVIDRPESKGGADAGPMGGEYFLTSVGGCFMSNLLAAIKARDAKISGVRVEVSGTLAEAPARFIGIELLVTGEGADQEMLDRLVNVADRACVMMNTLRGTIELSVRAGLTASR